MRIVVKIPTDQTISLDVEPSDSIKNVKEKIWDNAFIHPDQQILMLDFVGKQLKDSLTIADYWIHNGSTIRLVFFDRNEEIS